MTRSVNGYITSVDVADAIERFANRIADDLIAQSAGRNGVAADVLTKTAEAIREAGKTSRTRRREERAAQGTRGVTARRYYNYSPYSKNLDLGDSNDESPHVHQEIRAAELAAIALAYPEGPGMRGFDGAEIAGWIKCAFDSNKVPGQDGEWAGWLARAIFEHEEE